VYFSPFNQIHYGALIIALVRISIKCNVRFILLGYVFYQLLEIDAFQRLGMNIFSLQNIGNLHLQSIHFMSPAVYVE
jgi:hypothetical protein